MKLITIAAGVALVASPFTTIAAPVDDLVPGALYKNAQTAVSSAIAPEKTKQPAVPGFISVKIAHHHKTLSSIGPNMNTAHPAIPSAASENLTKRAAVSSAEPTPTQQTIQPTTQPTTQPATQPTVSESPVVESPKEERCSLTITRTDEWHDYLFYRRRRVVAKAVPGDSGLTADHMLDGWCTIFRWVARKPDGEDANRYPALNLDGKRWTKDDIQNNLTRNPQCWHTGPDEVSADLSAMHYQQYLRVEREAVRVWQEWSDHNCEVTNNV